MNNFAFSSTEGRAYIGMTPNDNRDYLTACPRISCGHDQDGSGYQAPPERILIPQD